MTKVAVVGTTSWGTTLACLLAKNGHDVMLVARDAEEADHLQQARANVRHLPGVSFPEELQVVIPEFTQGSEVFFLAVPSATLRYNLVRVLPFIGPYTLVVSAIKGIEPETGLRVSEIINQAGIQDLRVLVLSGPNFAREIAEGLPAATTVAGMFNAPERIQELLSSPTFRVYTSADVVGVEVAGALKNPIAIACGIADGLGFGENAKAAFITRALVEITRLGVKMGADERTFHGLAGSGDLWLTCQSNTSRNRRLGLDIAKGRSLSQALSSLGGVAEGAVTVKAIGLLAERYDVEMPICQKLYEVLYEGKDPMEAVQELLAREAKAEHDRSHNEWLPI